ncbi:MAG: 1-deoxy-D-xylulose-5-phosphate synthase N-terminal domain-containing protein [Nitrososphaeria archaeon]
MLKAFNENQRLILSSISKNKEATATSFLKELSEMSAIPLSTLKLNTKILRELDLVTYGTPRNPKPIRLTQTGKLISDILAASNSDFKKWTRGKRLSKEVKINVLKQAISSQSSHLPSSLSANDLVASIFEVFSPNLRNSENSFILSKGHAAPALYATLAEKKVISKDELLSLGSYGSRLQSHPERRYLPEVLVSTGSLGQGLSIGVGIALGKKIKNKKGKVIVLLGDGELNEGQVWEAIMSGAHHGLDNLIAIVDRNFRQLNGSTEKIKRLEPLEEKWASFGWEVIVVNGQETGEVVSTLEYIKHNQTKPVVVIALTQRNGGIKSLREDLFHYVPTAEEYERAVMDINEIES